MRIQSINLPFIARPLARGISACVSASLLAFACSDDPASNDPSATAGGSGGDSSVAAGASGGGAGGASPSAAGGGGSGGQPVSANGGSPPAAGGTGGSEGTQPTGLELVGTSTRPQLSPVSAATFTILDYLSQAGSVAAPVVDDWDPTAGVGDVSTFTATFRVAAAGGTHATVQEAITAAVTAGGTARQYIEVAAGTYREVVCVPSNAPPITLYSTNPDASQTVIAFDNYSGKAKEVGTPANPCNPSLDSATFGTSGSATFAAYGREFHAKNLSFVNDTDETTATGGVQGVALMMQGDRIVLENVRALGNQDTLFVKSPNVTTIARTYIKDCYVEGDTDFIFGRGTFVLDGCTIHSLTNRTDNGVVLAPSTFWQNPYGILIINSTFTGDAGAAAQSTHLGRAWDESQVDVATYTANVQTGMYPNGQAVIRDSTLGAHIQSAAPWRPAATTSRPYDSVGGTLPANRLYEFGNTGPGSAAPAAQ